ncbi:hypothetical protein [Streptosporangium sp. NBC_01756]|uniref:hypothetical protein n=1 Tax=Streptosporangium sp. NBC_01756 TaxID=2975950 RepID=UPI002DDB5AD2|nr:hypothetical protein [Streptosporangium sp. NBC_01756]WSC89749.1 hypothetical protein OIE48_16665 [Streptosporangium sp. NBC_01756]
MTASAPVRSRLGAASLVGAGILFLVYPVLRPYSDETTMEGARAMASSAWMVAHLSAVAGFILLTLGLLGLHQVLGRPLTLRAVVVTWIGAGLTLPYYGAEVFGLNVIARRAVQAQDVSLLELANEFRYGPAAVTMFGAGLVLLGVGAVMAAVAVWRSGVLPRWSALPLAAGFVLFLPQFFATPALRIAHGVLIAIGGVWLGVALWRARRIP